MAKSTTEFERWNAQEHSTWALRVLKKYNLELDRMISAQHVAHTQAYAALRDPLTTWSDMPSKVFGMPARELEHFKTLKEWSDAFNQFEDWVRLSAILTIASNLETYLGTVVPLALQSDPGVLFGASKMIDGAQVLKHRPHATIKASDQVENVIKGDWSSRLDAFENLFGAIPIDLRDFHSDLEKIRTIRNRFGHAFGRDIENARRYGEIEILPMEKVSAQSTARLKGVVIAVAQSIDQFLLEKHIGDFEAVQFYSKLYPKLSKVVARGQRAAQLKKEIGWFGAGLRGKKYCNGLVEYWENL